jgi:hypothetical protein
MIALITSVDYADFLAVTLPAWRALLPSATLRVVTSPRDRATHQVAARVGVEVVATRAWRADGARFNRAKALDQAIGLPASGELCLSVDADVYPCGVLPDERHFALGVLYGCARYLCRTWADAKAHLFGRVPREALPLMDVRLATKDGYAIAANTPDELQRTAAAGLGYFQAFRYAGQQFGSFPSAGGYDTAFAAGFAERRALEDLYVLHLGPSRGQNWTGRVLPTWRRSRG